MSSFRKLLAAVGGVLALSAAAAPLVQAQPLPGGSVELPPIEPIAVPVPAGSVAAQLPPLPFPLQWQDAAPLPPPAPRYVASNWIEEGSWCSAPNQRAFSQNGTTMWCVRLERTDGHQWAPHQATIPWTPERSGPGKGTSVRNSLGGKPCERVGATAIDPSNGQSAYCDWRRIASDVPVWQYEPGS